MNKLETAKTVGSFVVTMSVGAVINQAIQTVVPKSTRLGDRVVITIGSYVLASMIKDQAEAYYSKKFDKYVGAVKKFMDLVEETKEEEQ
jgi:prefoldin subunit 5